MSINKLLTKTKIAIIDLDNCISDDAWRLHMFELHKQDVDARYRNYHQHCGYDEIGNVHTLKAILRRYQIYIFTARPEQYRALTEKWLAFHGVDYKKLFMRGNDDHRCSVEVKRDMLNALPNKQDVVFAIDDRSDILAMYADEGIKMCMRVFINNIKE